MLQFILERTSFIADKKQPLVVRVIHSEPDAITNIAFSLKLPALVLRQQGKMQVVKDKLPPGEEFKHGLEIKPKPEAVGENELKIINISYRDVRGRTKRIGDKCYRIAIDRPITPPNLPTPRTTPPPTAHPPIPLDNRIMIASLREELVSLENQFKAVTQELAFSSGAAEVRLQQQRDILWQKIQQTMQRLRELGDNIS